MALDYLPSPGWAVIYGETPSATRWSELGDNDDALATGAGIDDLAILTRHLNNDAVTGAKIKNLKMQRQENTTNTTPATNIIQTGAGMITGNTTSTISEAVTFPVAFSAAPIVIANAIGFRPVADGYNIAGLSSWEGQTAQAGEPTATGFIARMRRNDGATYGNTTNYYYSWIAIGPE